MPHENVQRWRNNGMEGRRPCDWCGCVIGEADTTIHHPKCPTCGRACYRDESKFYTALGFDGEPPADVTLSPGYHIVIPKGTGIDLD